MKRKKIGQDNDMIDASMGILRYHENDIRKMQEVFI